MPLRWVWAVCTSQLLVCGEWLCVPSLGVCVFALSSYGVGVCAQHGCWQWWLRCAGAHGCDCVRVLVCGSAWLWCRYTKGICATALLNLMTKPQCREQLIREDVVWVLVKVRHSGGG